MLSNMRNRHALAGIIIILGVCTYLAYEVVRMNQLITAGASLSRSAQKFERPIGEKNEILILGDSLAYGVGASSPDKSFAGVLAARFNDKSVKNKAVIGETTSSLNKTIDGELTNHYEKIYIIVGGNDIMRMHINILKSSKSLRTAIEKASLQANEVVIMTAGDFDDVSLSPWALKPIFELRAEMIRNTALKLEHEYENFDYIDIKAAAIDSEVYKQLEAPDGYHLNDQGIEMLVSTMQSGKY